MKKRWYIFDAITRKASRKTPDGRLEFVDAMRAYAILMMLQGHVIALTLADQWRVQDNPFYTVWRHMRGVTAPTFFFASGLIVAYLLFRNRDAFDVVRFRKNFLRAGRLIILGYILQLSWEVPVCLIQGEPCAWEWALRTHVLHTIGVGMIVVSLLAYASKKYRWLFPVLALILTHAAFVLGSAVTVQEELPGVLALFSTYVLNRYAAFPALTWVGFTLSGATVGFLVVELRLHRHAWIYLVFLYLGYLLKSNAWHILRDAYADLWSDYSMFLDYAVFTYYRLGEVLMVAGVLGILTRFVNMPRVIHAVAKETLGIFFLHAIVVYGAVFGFGMSTFFWHAWTPFVSVVAALLLVVVFMLYAAWAPKIRERIPLMRYLK